MADSNRQNNEAPAGMAGQADWKPDRSHEFGGAIRVPANEEGQVEPGGTQVQEDLHTRRVTSSQLKR